MANTIYIKKGLDIPLAAQAHNIISLQDAPQNYAIKPTDFVGIRPKLLVEEGEHVLIGTPLFYDKHNEQIHICSPVSGTIKTIIRGEKRRIEAIVIASDNQFQSLPITLPDTLTPATITDTLLRYGQWAYLRQRPYNTIANPNTTPKAIIISTFSTAPLAPNAAKISLTNEGTLRPEIAQGINILHQLAPCPIYLNTNFATEQFDQLEHVITTHFAGPHPAGNVGTQIHYLCPLKKDEIVWHIGLQDLMAIGTLFTRQHLNTTRIITLAGAGIKNPIHYRTHIGSSIEEYLTDNLTAPTNQLRFISGDPLTGTQISANGFLGFYDTQFSVIPETRERNLFGWFFPAKHAYNIAYPLLKPLLKYLPQRNITPDSNLHGERRNFVVSEEYESVFPFRNIMPVELLKACLSKNTDLMEDLGIYELSGEDLALCEFVCTSKINAQQIIEDGLALLRETNEQ